jgi:hypothetical protein
MKHVVLASGNREESWTGFNPGKTKPKASTKEQHLHEPRGVTENFSICRDNGLDHNLVLGECPKRGDVKHVFLGSKSVSHGPHSPSPEQKEKEPVCELDCKIALLGTEKLSNVQALLLPVQSGSDDDNCKRERGPQNEGPQDAFEPVNFEAAPDTIEAFSDRLANDIPALLTGPKLIMCNSRDQASCSAVEMSNSQQDGKVITTDDPNGGTGKTVELVGTGMVCNFFTVDLKDWFFCLEKEHEQSEREGKKKKSEPELESEPLWDPMVVVKSPGMVFVNVKHKMELKGTLKSKKGKKSQMCLKRRTTSQAFGTIFSLMQMEKTPTRRLNSDSTFPSPLVTPKTKRRAMNGRMTIFRRAWITCGFHAVSSLSRARLDKSASGEHPEPKDQQPRQRSESKGSGRSLALVH